MRVRLAAWLVFFFLPFSWGWEAAASSADELRETVLSEARALLEAAQISYVYGGHQLGSPEDCESCNRCLAEKSPKPKERWSACPICVRCSLDCSHFTQLVHRSAGIPYPYLNTQSMLDLPKEVLEKRYRLVDLGRDLARALPGDLLVYKGHVVLLEALYPEPQNKGRGDILHATGGRDVKGPGQGIQRERFVPLASFRGPLLRILRHSAFYASKKGTKPLRPVMGRGPARVEPRP